MAFTLLETVDATDECFGSYTMLTEDTRFRFGDTYHRAPLPQPTTSEKPEPVPGEL